MIAENGWHETGIRIRYKDTDRMGVVYYGNYLTFFEVGRSEYLRDIGFPYSKLESKGYHFVVTEAAAKYHANVSYDSIITVRTRVADVKNVRLRFEYEVMSEEGGLLVSGHTVHGCLNSNQKPTRMPAELKTLVEQKVTGSKGQK
ncbi:acyl-CoA thioesterase [Thermodesulfobacteriota bacterium]